MIEIAEIGSEETHDMRHRILRPTQAISKCKYPGDSLEGAFHLGAFEGDSLVGIVSFSQEDIKEVGATGTYRLRGMAVEESHRRQGIGQLLVEFAIHKLRERSVKTLWCRAREVAYQFYEDMKFEYISDVYEIEDIGPHRTMMKKL